MVTIRVPHGASRLIAAAIKLGKDDGCNSRYFVIAIHVLKLSISDTMSLCAVTAAVRLLTVDAIATSAARQCKNTVQRLSQYCIEDNGSTH